MKLTDLMRRIGRLCFLLMWIPFITLFIGMIGMPDGSYSWEELPVLTRYSIVIGGSLMAASVVLQVGAPITAGIITQSVLARGLPAQATILKITDTGTTINQNPLVRLLLEVHPQNEPPFQAETERIIPRLQIPEIQPGVMLEVKYDPASKDVALIDAE